MLQNKVSACPKKAKERTKNLRSLLCAKLNFCLMLHVQMLYVLHEQSMCTERGEKWKCSHLFMRSPLDTKNRPLLTRTKCLIQVHKMNSCMSGREKYAYSVSRSLCMLSDKMLGLCCWTSGVFLFVGWGKFLWIHRACLYSAVVQMTFCAVNEGAWVYSMYI